MAIREQIYYIPEKPLPANLTAADVINGECSFIPPDSHLLVQGIICGTDPRSVKSEGVQRKVTSMCFDFIHNTTHGAVKTSKHMTTGIALKSITSSRQVVDLLNKLGHVSSYHVVEQLETEATYASISRSVLCPDGIELSPEFLTGLAFDNFDRFTETSNGKDTLHNTVGIIYQNDFGDNNHVRTLLSDHLAVLISQHYPEYYSMKVDFNDLNNSGLLDDSVDTEISSPALERRRFE